MRKLRENWKAILAAFILGVALSCNEPMEEDAQEDSADDGWCFSVQDLLDTGPEQFIYREFQCPAEGEDEPREQA